jgi:hypothetical protein
MVGKSVLVFLGRIITKQLRNVVLLATASDYNMKMVSRGQRSTEADKVDEQR